MVRNLLPNFLPSRLVKKKGSVAEKIKSRMIDMLKKLLASGLNLPEFHATDLSRLPPVKVEHIDISAFLQEISLLRTEVRVAMSIRVELADIHASLNYSSPINTGNCNKTSVKSPSVVVTINPTASSVNTYVTSPSNSTARFASVTSRFQPSAAVLRPAGKIKPVIGSASNCKSKAVAAKRSVELFVMCLEPNTTPAEVSANVADAIHVVGIPFDDVKVLALETKHASYACFHISLVVNAENVVKVYDYLFADDGQMMHSSGNFLSLKVKDNCFL